MPAPSAARTVSRLSFSLSDQAVPRPSLPREGRQFANMPVAAATAQANADARSEAKAFAKENVHGIQPSSHGFTTLMLALFAIMTDITDDFVPALLLRNHVTTQIPLASILRNSRYLDVDMGAFHAGGGGAAAGGGGHAQVQATSLITMTLMTDDTSIMVPDESYYPGPVSWRARRGLGFYPVPAHGGGARLGKLSFENRTASKLEHSAPHTGSDQKHSTAKARQDVRPDRFVLHKAIQRDRSRSTRARPQFFSRDPPSRLFVCLARHRAAHVLNT